MDVRLDRPDGALDDQLDADGGGEVVDDVRPVDELRDDGCVLRGVDRVREAGLVLEVPDVLDRAGGKVVEDVDLVAALEQLVGEMGADEAGSAGDQVPHADE